MQRLQSVRLVGPYAGEGWIGISNYTDEIAALSGTCGVRIDRASASWWAPRGVDRWLDRRRGRRPLDWADASGSQVVHLTDQGLGHLVGRMEGRPSVVTCHDVMPFVVPGFYSGRVQGLVRRGLLRPCMRGMVRATRIIAVSESTAGGLVARFGVDRGTISVVPVPTSADFVRVCGAEGRLAARGISLPPGPRVMSIGDVSPNKNIELLVRAMAEPALRAVSLVRVGAALSRAQGALADQLGVAPRIYELGRISRETLVEVYGACQVLAQPSLFEGFGMPVAEAMACGTPVVCSDGGALPETAGGAATIVAIDPRAPATNQDVVRAFAAALADVLTDPQLAGRLVADGFARAATLRPAHVAPVLFDAYERALRDGG